MLCTDHPHDHLFIFIFIFILIRFIYIDYIYKFGIFPFLFVCFPSSFALSNVSLQTVRYSNQLVDDDESCPPKTMYDHHTYTQKIGGWSNNRSYLDSTRLTPGRQAKNSRTQRNESLLWFSVVSHPKPKRHAMTHPSRAAAARFARSTRACFP
jgi:hypothetical protein